MSGAKLNDRLRTVASFVRQDAIFADIGTDHAYLPVFLLSVGRIKKAYATDINEGPLNKARENIASAGYSNAVELRLANGAEGLSDLGIEDYAICGMGGELIADIIKASAHLMSEEVLLHLQPMSRQEHLRKYLGRSGFAVIGEGYSFDGGKYYLSLSAKYTGIKRNVSDEEAAFGDKNIEIVNKSAQIGYIKSKIRALKRAAEGKIEGGDQALSELALIAHGEEYLAFLTAGASNDERHNI